MKNTFLMLLLVLANGIFAQAPADSVDDVADLSKSIYLVKLPVFPGGDKGVMQYLTDNVRYPRKARRKGIEGVVNISIIVEKDGTISNVHALNDIGGGCTQAAIRVVKRMPKWEPGISSLGSPVRVRHTLPIRFRLK